MMSSISSMIGTTARSPAAKPSSTNLRGERGPKLHPRRREAEQHEPQLRDLEHDLDEPQQPADRDGRARAARRREADRDDDDREVEQVERAVLGVGRERGRPLAARDDLDDDLGRERDE